MTYMTASACVAASCRPAERQRIPRRAVWRGQCWRHCWRRRQGHDPREIPPAGAFLAERPDTLLATLRQAMTAGFARAVPSVEDDGEVNLVLAARNDEAADSADRLQVVFLTVCAARLHLAPADALLLTPGEYLDMVTLLGGKEADDGSQNDYN